MIATLPPLSYRKEEEMTMGKLKPGKGQWAIGYGKIIVSTFI